MIAWTPPASNGSALVGYEVRITPDCACTGRQITDPATTSTGIAGLSPGTNYTFAVRAASDVGSSGYSEESDSVVPIPVLKVMTWNLHRGLDQGGEAGGGPISAFLPVIIQRQVDVAGFQEITEDQANELSQSLGRSVYWEPSADPCDFPGQSCVEYGNAILSRYPMQNQTFWDLPPTDAEEGGVDRVLLRATINVEGFLFTVYNTHLANDGTVDERAAQASAVVAQVENDGSSFGSALRPIFLCDCNVTPGHPAWRVLAGTDGASVGPFLDAWRGDGGETNNDRTRRIDYVFVGRGSGFPIGNVIVDYSAEGASDHYPVIAEI